MDLELVLYEFIGGSTSINTSDPAKNMAEMAAYIRKFVKQHSQKTDLLTQYQNAVAAEEYELAETIRNNILEIIKDK